MSKLIFMRSQSIFEYLSASTGDASEIVLPHVIKEHADLGFPLTIFMYVLMGLSFLFVIYYTFNKLLGSRS